MISCSKCGNVNPDGAPNCYRCGEALGVGRGAGGGFVPAQSDLLQGGATEAAERAAGHLAGFAAQTVIEGRYRVDRELGQGAMGAVYECTDLRLGRRVALKALHTELLAHPTARARMEAEARALAAIQHRNVVEIRNIIEYQGVLLLELELVTGGNLAQRIAQRGVDGHSALPLAVAILSGLAAIHRVGLVHRDLKPANVLIGDDGSPKIADLGVAHELGVKGKTKTGTRLGTPEYMSPEQVRGQTVDERTDIYAMGVILYEMVAGVVPFDGESEFDVLASHVHQRPDLDRIRGKAPSAVVDAIGRALAKDPAARWQTATEFAEGLQRSVADQSAVFLPLGGGGIVADVFVFQPQQIVHAAPESPMPRPSLQEHVSDTVVVVPQPSQSEPIHPEPAPSTKVSWWTRLGGGGVVLFVLFNLVIRGCCKQACTSTGSSAPPRPSMVFTECPLSCKGSLECQGAGICMPNRAGKLSCLPVECAECYTRKKLCSVLPNCTFVGCAGD